MSRRSVIRQNILKEFEDDLYPVSDLNRDLKKVSKDRWKLKEAKRERRRANRIRGNH